MTRITAAEALRLYEQEDLVALGRSADEMRRRMHPENLGTFVVDRNINYTKACWADCSFCAF